MAHDDPYRRNPARDVEQLALGLIASWLGDGGQLTDTSSGHGPDFRIEYRDGRVAVGEVGWHEDRDMQEMWANVFREEHHQLIELRKGLGQWAVRLVPGASIKRLYAELPAFVASLAEAGPLEATVYGNWPRTEFADTARQLGVEHVAQVNQEEPAMAVFFIDGPGGIVPTDPNCITDWLDEALADPDYQDTTAKVLAIEADERHVFLMTGTRTAFGADERLRRLSEALPTRSPDVPDGITHVWAVSRFGEGPAALWVEGVGWSAVPSPT